MTTKSKEDVVTTMLKADTIESQIEQINHPIHKEKTIQFTKSHNYSTMCKVAQLFSLSPVIHKSTGSPV